MTSSSSTSLGRGNLYTISAPSGAGKTSLVKELIESSEQILVSISHTTRAMRPGEVDGINYHFIDQAQFKSMLQADDFLEHAEVFGNFYGTSKQWVEQTLATGSDVILEIDWQGAQQLTQAASDDLVRIFILPPSKHALEQRLHTRAQDSAAVISKRMAQSESEMSHWAEYDYVIVNEDLNTAMGELRTIVAAERLKRRRQLWLGPFVKQLTEGR